MTAKYEAALAAIKSHPFKASAMRQKKLSGFAMIEVLPYHSLTPVAFAKLLNLCPDDWMAYGEMKELEYFCNRDGAEGDGKTEEDGYEVLSNEAFDAQFAHFERQQQCQLTHALYLEMRGAEEAWLKK